MCLRILNLLSYGFGHQKPPAWKKASLLQYPSRAGVLYSRPSVCLRSHNLGDVSVG